MKKTLLILSITLLGTLLGFNVMGQNENAKEQAVILGMPEVSLLRVVATVPVNLTLTTTTAGDKVAQSISNEATKLLISSVITGTSLRSVSAKVSAVPPGTYLNLGATAPTSGNEGGTMAATGGYLEVPLSATVDGTIISGIGSCYSGIAEADGYVLKYTWGLLDAKASYADVRATGASNTVTVTLTLTAANN